MSTVLGAIIIIGLLNCCLAEAAKEKISGLIAKNRPFSSIPKEATDLMMIRSWMNCSS